jgi:hypothetical protein
LLRRANVEHVDPAAYDVLLTWATPRRTLPKRVSREADRRTGGSGGEALELALRVRAAAAEIARRADEERRGDG